MYGRDQALPARGLEPIIAQNAPQIRVRASQQRLQAERIVRRDGHAATNEIRLCAANHSRVIMGNCQL
jgi:hypothetical protein